MFLDTKLRQNMKKDRNRDKGPRDKDPKSKNGESKDEMFQPINTGLVTTDADEWKGIEMNNENKAEDEINKPVNQVNTGEDKEGREEADDELNTHEQKKITNKNRNIVNKPD
jgi:hypothetical protein